MPQSEDEKTKLGHYQKEWRTVIVGLPIIRKLLNAEDVTLNDFLICLIPDDVLWNNQPRALADSPVSGREKE